MRLLISYSSIYSTPFGSYRQLLTRGPISDRTCGRWRRRRAGLWYNASLAVTWWSNADRAASSRSATYTPTSRPPPAARPRTTISASSALLHVQVSVSRDLLFCVQCIVRLCRSQGGGGGWRAVVGVQRALLDGRSGPEGAVGGAVGQGWNFGRFLVF